MQLRLDVKRTLVDSPAGGSYRRVHWISPPLFVALACLLPLGAHAAGKAAPKKGTASSTEPSKAAEPAPEEVDLADLEPAEPEPAPESTSSGSAAAASTSASTGAAGAAGGAIVGPASGQHLMFLEAGFRHDWGTFSQQDRSGANVVTDIQDYDSFHSTFHLGFLERVAERVRVGGALGYLGNYEAGNELLGQMLTLDMRVEFALPVAPKWAIIGTPRFGASMIIPGGILAREINDLQSFGFDTWSGPRFGFLVGGDVGARFGLNDWLSVRATVGYAWFITLLLNSYGGDSEFPGAVSWTAQASRLNGNIGLEVAF
jgi:hypothetical protein